ncbi:radical SAM family heme chaperone HemW [Pokkaliibacter sp. MBI-7]|uniref:radical SAM family heme chaperone HemW n=1 Tax=Pokkaliibacter sp. MBI-7 TaxID=3040600 RepID=UPI002449E5DB|nr:radical SAM family heme chaperone HemW [Pokkaliibacter sp. MBI-7]MDH2432284.1 radical SAM family heme chaperone HemW [Pokkaliibacter sp. MBI-7]
MLQLPPLSLYIHIPWCVRKCPYCDFNSHAVRDELPEQEYVARLLEDLEQEQVAAQGREITSIFIGGGTPSLFSEQAIDQLLCGIARRVTLADDCEVTMEANPGTFEAERFAGFRQAGVNRLSVGIQSFDDDKLQRLGRIHSSRDAIAAVEKLHQLGFDNFNLDLMHGLPEQTLQQGLADLRQAIALQPAHISWYQLTIEPNTEYYSRPPQLPEDEALWAIQEEGHELLQAAGYGQYETSAYAQAGRRARHNLNYWQFGDYLGIGAGAHGKVSWQATGQIVRRWKTRMPQHYLDRSRLLVAGEQQVEADELPFEFMMNALRLVDGVPSAWFEQRTGLTKAIIDDAVRLGQDRGLLDRNEDAFRPTALGQRYLNDLLELFL